MTFLKESLLPVARVNTSENQNKQIELLNLWGLLFKLGNWLQRNEILTIGMGLEVRFQQIWETCSRLRELLSCEHVLYFLQKEIWLKRAQKVELKTLENYSQAFRPFN